MDKEESIPIKVIDDMIAELSEEREEREEANRMITHAIITLQLLKNRWRRMQNERGS